MIERHFEPDSGIIRVTGTGAWSFSEIEQHYAALRILIAGLREDALPIRILSDVRQGQRQAGWVEDYIADQMRQTFRDGDRIALLTASAADKAHVHALSPVAAIASFTSHEAARQWLLLAEGAAESA